MAAPEPLLWLAAAIGVAGIGVLRFAWSKRKRSIPLNTAGWALLALAAIGGGAAEGAWGVSVVSLFAMGAAALALAHAAATSPQGKGSASVRRVRMLPEMGGKLHLGRRVVTFLLVAIAGLAVSVGLGVALRGLAGIAGMSEANSNVAAFFAVPVLWALLSFFLLMLERRRGQILLLLACCIPILPLFLTGAPA